jgi:hAT family C-terminal dimerisation region
VEILPLILKQTRIEPGKLFSWWNEQASTPIARQMAFDLLSIPAMNIEVERVFNDTKLTISQQRMRLGADITEAEECERAWLKGALNGLSERGRGL